MLELARQQDINITEDIIKKLHRLFYQKVDAEQAGQYRIIQVSIPPTWRNDYINVLSVSKRLDDMEPFSKLIAECVIETERDYCRLLKL